MNISHRALQGLTERDEWIAVDMHGRTGEEVVLAARLCMSLSADKGYYSAANVRHLKSAQVKDIGLQPKANIKRTKDLAKGETMRRLKDRRAGIEPLIGHAKHGGQLGKSLMKSVAATLAAGYASVSRLNLRQLGARRNPDAATPTSRGPFRASDELRGGF